MGEKLVVAGCGYRGGSWAIVAGQFKKWCSVLTKLKFSIVLLLRVELALSTDKLNLAADSQHIQI